MMLAFVAWGEVEQVLGVERDQPKALAATAGAQYRPFDLRKPGSKSLRHIDNPVAKLKNVQRRIFERLLLPIPLPETMTGGVRGRSTRDNARFHVGQPVLVTIDLRNCFGKIDDLKVFRVFRNTVGCSDEIAGVLTQLCTVRHRLPQGAPTSAALANLVLLPLHRKLLKLGDELGLACSFYIDDIAFSGDRAREVVEPACRLLTEAGHPVKSQKTAVMTQHEEIVVKT